MPATRRDSLGYQRAVALGVRRVFPFVALLIAEEAGRDNVAFQVLAAVLPGNQVLGGTLKPSGLGGRQSVLRCKRQRIGRPHGLVAVEATAILAAKGRETEFG